MSIFGKIKDAIFGKPAPAKEPPARARTGNAYADAPTVAPSRPQQTTVINIENSFDSMPGADRLNWRTSIVDLMKALDIDSSLPARKDLAKELGYSGDMNDSASMNVWLHKQVMSKLAANGGKLPPEIKH